MAIALFEDSHWQNFLPLTFTKATFDVKVGARSFFEEYAHPPEILLTRKYLAKVTGERHDGCKVNPPSLDGDTVFVNGLLHPGAIELGRLGKISHTFAVAAGKRLLVARLGRKDSEYVQECVSAGKKIDPKKLRVEKSTNVPNESLQGLLSDPWDVIRVLENSLGMQVNSEEKIIVGEGAEIEQGAVLDTKNGGIYIGPGAHVEPCRISGPAYIGGKTLVKQFSIIESSYVGYNCRVAGEIEHSIISDHTNKAHAGFVGHSYIGEWVNIGAMTTTSDLKMTYGNIKINADGKKVDTGLNKVGSFVADMAKTSIGTLIYSGRRIGVSSHLHGLVAEDVPGFSIYGKSIGAKNAELELASAIETQRKMMSRRNQTMSKAYEQMIKDVFALTATDRKREKISRSKFSL